MAAVARAAYAGSVFGVLLFVTLSQQAQAQLLAAARASGRPPECAVIGHAQQQNGVWARARSPKRQRYCQLVARAQARVQLDPVAAQKDASAAAKLLPNRAAPHVVMARAALAQDDVARADEAFATALKLDPRSVDQPLALHDLARTQRRAGRLVDALNSYRRLAPRAALLPGRERRAAALLEAAHVAMTKAGDGSDDIAGARHLDEALAFLREATRDPNHGLHNDVLLSLALALDRAGMAPQADAILAEQRGAKSWLQRNLAKPPDYLSDPNDVLALQALAAQNSNRAAALASWNQYLSAPDPSAPFAAAAKLRRDALMGPTPRGSKPAGAR